MSVFTFTIVLEVSAKPCDKPNSVFKISSTALTIKLTIGTGVYQTPLAFLNLGIVFC